MESDGKVNNNNASHIVFTNIDDSVLKREQLTKNNPEDEKNIEAIREIIIEFTKNTVDERNNKEHNDWKKGEVPGVFLYHGIYYLANEEGIRLLNNRLVKDKDVHRLCVCHNGFGNASDMEQCIEMNLKKQLSNEECHREVVSLKQKLKTKFRYNNDKEVEDVINICFPDYEKNERMYNDIIFIPNLMLSDEQKDTYIADKFLDACMSPLKIIATSVPEADSLPSSLDLQKIADRSKEVLNKLELPQDTKIYQEPISYGNYICTAIVNKILSDDSRYKLDNNQIVLQYIPTSTYKDLDYKSLAEEVATMFSDIQKKTNEENFNLLIGIVPADEKKNALLQFHPFSMTKKFLLELNNKLADSNIKVNVSLFPECSHNKHCDKCADCQAYGECCKQMIEDEFIKVIQPENGKDGDNYNLKVNTMHNAVSYSLNGKYEPQKISNSFLGCSCW